jgi:hypothetical protein
MRASSTSARIGDVCGSIVDSVSVACGRSSMLDTSVCGRNRSRGAENRSQRTHLIDGRGIAFTHASLERLHDPAHPLAIFKPDAIALQHFDPFCLLKAHFAFLDKTLVDRFLRRGHHLPRNVCPRIDRGTHLLHGVLGSKQEREDVGGRRAFTNALDDAIAYLLRQCGEFGVAPAFSKEPHERASGTSLEVVVRDVVGEREFEDAWDSAGTLAAATTTGAPLGARDALVLVELEERVIEAVEHLVDDAGLGFVVEMREREIVCGAQDGKRGVEVVCAMREHEGAGVDVAEGEVEGCGGERRRGERDRERLARRGWCRSRLGTPGEELGAKVRGAGDEDEAVGGEDGGGVLGIGRGKRAGEGDADVGVETGAPHVHQVLAQLVDTVFVGVEDVAWLGAVEEKLKGLAEALSRVEVLELVGEEGGGYLLGETENAALVGGRGGGRGAERGRRARVVVEGEGERDGGLRGGGGRGRGVRGRGRDGRRAEGEVARLEGGRGTCVDDRWGGSAGPAGGRGAHLCGPRPPRWRRDRGRGGVPTRHPGSDPWRCGRARAGRSATSAWRGAMPRVSRAEGRPWLRGRWTTTTDPQHVHSG